MCSFHYKYVLQKMWYIFRIFQENIALLLFLYDMWIVRFNWTKQCTYELDPLIDMVSKPLLRPSFAFCEADLIVQ